jgi:hypothetical protein
MAAGDGAGGERSGLRLGSRERGSMGIEFFFFFFFFFEQMGIEFSTKIGRHPAISRHDRP